ncbi:MAG TPA: BatA domain-containing protein [Gemmatimonadales bacterium]|nr:BatA domain-containing protein [Gemmatimonadales bacterium]
MLGLLTPVWLAGLGALIVPLALHLWSRRGGHPVRVGSIRLLAGSPPATRRSWTVQEPWLLALRCAVLAAIALALAGPYWTSPGAGGRTLALVARDVRDREAVVDSLHNAGVPVSLLDSAASGIPNLWTALRRADRRAAPGTRFVVFAPDLLRYFRGERPALRSPVEWHTRAAAASAVPVNAPPQARIVVVFADAARLDDARYVRAAFEAAGTATGIAAIVSVRPASAAALAGPADWLVWLSDRAIPDSLQAQVQRGAVLLSDAGVATAPRHHSRVVTGAQPSNAWLTSATSGTGGSVGAPVWEDGTGSPLLTVTREERGVHYRFHSRFSPGWGDFVLRPAFPLAMARLWSVTDSNRSAADDRRITVRQIIPAQDSEAASPQTPRRPLFLGLWALAALLFLAERWMSRRPRLGMA